MSRLFWANMMRLGKSRIFLVGELFAAGYALLVYGSAVSTLKSGRTIAGWNMYLFNVLLVIGIAVAVFDAVFLHAEYGQGTVRNKLATGARRRDVYLANYAVCALAGLCMYATYLLCGFLLGLVLVGPETLRVAAPAQGIFFGIVAVAGYTALGVSVEMLIANKSVSMAVSLVGTGLLLLLGMSCYAKLVNLGEQAGFGWRLIEMFDPAAACFYVVTADRPLSAHVVFALLIEAACLTGIGAHCFAEKDIQ